MADHADLVREMVDLEKLSSQERLKLARKRRQAQVSRKIANIYRVSLVFGFIF